MSRTDRLAETSTAPLAADPAANTFSVSVVVSGIRCLLTYVVFPWVLPVLGLAAGIGPAIGLAVGTIAIAFNVASIRRFWASDHRLKWPITFVNATVIVLLSVLIGLDIADLA